jgi:ABC-2 type transport system ATP-binding protein
MAVKVAVRDLRKRYGDVHAAHGVSFDIEEGEIFGLLGPNGSGKTTTVECVVGLREPDAGEIEVCGIDARRHPRGVKQKIGATLQTTALQDMITPREALKLFGSFYTESASPREVLDRFSLAHKADEAFHTLSGGQRQRLALALAFVNRPEVVFLDEPTAGLDPQSRRELRGEIAAMKRGGHTVLLTTHEIDEAEQLCDRVAVINRGRVVATGAPRDLIAGSASTQSVSLITVQPIGADVLAGIIGVQDAVCDGRQASFRSTDISATLTGLVKRLDAAGIEIAELQVRKATLEDVFLELTGSGS